MSALPNHPTQSYWDTAADTYEQDFTGTLLGRLQREAIWRELEYVFCSGQRVLELNCGTGIDAVHLAQRGVNILACDISPGMIGLASKRVTAAKLHRSIDLRVLATEDIGQLGTEGAFDGAFSNFSGMNCVADLSAASAALARLLKPGSRVLLCMLGRIVPWEIIWFLAHGEPQKAMLRLRCRDGFCPGQGAPRVHYPSVKEIAVAFAPAFGLRKWKGVGIVLPPTYMAHWANRFPKIAGTLAQADRFLGSWPGFRNMAGFVLLEFERVEATGYRP
jgi:SAM-dependent methyltransferase